MNYYFVLISFAIIAYYAVMLFFHPQRWLFYLHSLPVFVFMVYARCYGMNEQAWVGAFELAGALAIGVIIILWHHGILFDRIMLGFNIFLIIGGIGFLCNCEPILYWYSTSHGGPLFICIALVGLLSTFATKAGFIGTYSKNKDAVRYASFLLLIATFIALVWSVRADADGILWAVVLPFLVLCFIRYQLSEHLL